MLIKLRNYLYIMLQENKLPMPALLVVARVVEHIDVIQWRENKGY